MKIKSYIRKIIALAFVVLSLSLIFPAVSYAKTPPAPICNDTNEINEEYILTNKENANLVLSRYNPESGFSGVYNIDTKQWMALPSQGASLKTDKDKGEFCTVEAKGGHLMVQKKFNETIDNKFPDQNLGFFIQENPNKKNTLDIKFVSGKINCCYNKRHSECPLRIVPVEYEKAIKNAIQTTMVGYEVEKQDYSVYKSFCKQPDDFENCGN